MISTIAINGLTLGTYASGYLFKRLEGFGFPQIAINVKERGNFHGAKLSGYRYSRRLITIELQILGTTLADYETKRSNLIKALTIISGLNTVTFTTKSGLVVTADCILNGEFEAGYKSGNGVFSDARIELVAPYPFFLGQTDESVDLAVSGGGGFAIPFGIGLDMSTGSTGATTVTNDGNGEAYPIVTLYGTLENPSIYNETSGLYLALNYTLSTISDVLVIDFYNRTAVLNGSTNLKSYITGDFWTLLAGANTIRLTSANTSDSGSGNIAYNDSYLGL